MWAAPATVITALENGLTTSPYHRENICKAILRSAKPEYREYICQSILDKLASKSETKSDHMNRSSSSTMWGTRVGHELCRLALQGLADRMAEFDEAEVMVWICSVPGLTHG